MEYLKVRVDFADVIGVLTDAENGRLFKAMLQYAADGKEPENLFGNEQYVWPSGKRELDIIALNDQKMRQLASLGGKAKARSRQQETCVTNTNISAANDTHSDAKDSLSDGRNMFSDAINPLSVSRTGKEKRRENEEEKERSKEKEEERENRKEKDLSRAFERFRAAYPRHVGKQTAWNSFRKLKPDAELLDTMLNAVERSKLSDQWRRDEGQYIPHPTTWLNQRRWEDEFPTVSCRPAPGPIPRPVEKARVPAQDYHQRDYSHMQDEAMARFLEAVAEMEAEQAMKDQTREGRDGCTAISASGHR